MCAALIRRELEVVERGPELRVENQPNGAVRAQGKAWPVGEAEPAAWTIEKVEPNGNREGAPGLFIDAQFGATLDNFKLTAN